MTLIYHSAPTSAPPRSAGGNGLPVRTTELAHQESSRNATLCDVGMPRRGRRRSRGAMSVEYALMLVLVSGMLLTGLGAVVKGWFGNFGCALEQGMNNGGTCTVGSPVPTTQPTEGSSGSGGTTMPTTSPTATCDPASDSSAPESQAGEASATDCPTPSSSDAGAATSSTN